MDSESSINTLVSSPLAGIPPGKPWSTATKQPSEPLQPSGPPPEPWVALRLGPSPATQCDGHYEPVTRVRLSDLPLSVHSQYGPIVRAIQRGSPATAFRDLVDNFDAHHTTAVRDVCRAFDLASDAGRMLMTSLFVAAVQKYVFGAGAAKEAIRTSVPACIGIPAFQFTSHFGLPLTATHASVNLFNCSNPDEFTGDPADLHVNFTVSGREGEVWFYKIHIAIEITLQQGLAPILALLPEPGTPPVPRLPTTTARSDSCHVPSDPMQDPNTILEEDIKCTAEELHAALDALMHSLEASTALLRRMPIGCSAVEFWNEIRPGLSGYNNAGVFPGGLRVEGTDIVITSKGGSAAQSTSIQLVDVLLPVPHVPHAALFLQEMRMYMPAAHREYLERIERLNTIPLLERLVTNRFPHSDALRNAHAACRAALTSFRKAHMGLVHTHVLHFISKQTPGAGADAPGHALSNDSVGPSEPASPRVIIKTDHVNGNRGTSNTDPITILGQIIEDTVHAPALPPSQPAGLLHTTTGFAKWRVWRDNSWRALLAIAGLASMAYIAQV
eukprot:m.224759 g.224759  ORF g.224759 m.224759 type:complete len:557 (+) comp11147_c0_seq1:188-1858(+)